MITESQKKKILRKNVHQLLNADRNNQRYYCMERLWEMSGLTHKDLVDVLLSDSNNDADDFKKSIFYDMVNLLLERIIEDPLPIW